MKISLKLTSALLALAATTASLGLISPAHAQETNATSISTTDIDLSSSKGQRVLDLRIARAAEMLCYDANVRLDISARKTSKACRASVVRAAQTTINARTAAQIASR
jgi:UrcA family protein